jgi:WD40 repeat protein
MQNHSAAVTSIVDMGDGQTIISGSYDKKINIYNYKTSALV